MNEEKLKEMQVEQKAKALKNAYQREWRRKNNKPTPEKRREYNRRYWLKKAAAECIADLVEEQQNQK